MSTDLLLLILRICTLALLYLFLARVAFALWHDLRRAPVQLPAPQTTRQPGGRLVVTDPAGSGLPRDTAFDLTPVTTIGRQAENSIVIDDDFVSSAHATVAWRNDGWWVQDMNSTNGTFVGMRKVNAITKLAEGETLQIGRVRLRLES